VARRITMTIEIWDRQPLREQERVIGRTKAEGAPLSGGTGFPSPTSPWPAVAASRWCRRTRTSG